MSLFLVPSDESPGDSKVMHGQLLVGQIYQRSSALAAETQWLWALNGVPEGPLGLSLTGLTATREDAFKALTQRWAKWLEWANLAERG
jgi:hypothetical protein